MNISNFDLNWYRQWCTEHSYIEEWSRPGLTNFLGSVQTANDISSLRHVVFPPVSASEETTAYLTVNGRFLPALPVKTEQSWTPWSVARKVELEELTITSTTSMPWEYPVVVLSIEEFPHFLGGV